MKMAVDMKKGFLVTALVAGMHAVPAWAADVPVSYKVDPAALKAAVAGTMVTFELHADSACSAAIASESVDIADPAVLIDKLSLSKVKGGPKLSKVSRLEYVMSGVTPTESMYLKVTGTGIAAAGGDCQIQSSVPMGGAGPAGPEGPAGATGPAGPVQAMAFQCTSTSLDTFSISANSANFFNNPACPAGYTAVTPYCWTAALGVYSQGSGYNSNVAGNSTFCAWQNTTGSAQQVFGGNVCCRVPAAP